MAIFQHYVSKVNGKQQKQLPAINEFSHGPKVKYWQFYFVFTFYWYFRRLKPQEINQKILGTQQIFSTLQSGPCDNNNLLSLLLLFS